MWIGISKKIERDNIKSELKLLYPGSQVGVLDDISELPDDKSEWPDIVATLDFNDSEFPLVIHFVWWPKAANESDELQIAKSWGSKYDCKTIIDGSNYGDDESPFWCIVFDNGAYYLADDCESKFGDGTTGKGPVKIVREIQPKK